jgi:Flp pilus assembly pilin Flp
MLGASLNEIGLVALLLALVLMASKVSAIGEAIGGFFAGSSKAEDPPRPSARPDDT